MEYNLQSKQISEKIVNILDDFKYQYAKEYKLPPCRWDRIQIQTYVLNCDAEIQCLLERNDIDINERTYFVGITFGILVIKYEVLSSFYLSYGKQMEYFRKEEMYERLYEEIFNYIINGIEE